MNLPLCPRSLAGLLFVFLFGGAARAADAPPIKPPGVRTKALEAKLAELKRRGLNYSDAVAFWPLGDGEGIVLRTFGTLGKANPWLLATAAIDCEWTKESRFKGHAALRCKPPLSTINGGGRVVAWKDGPLTVLTVAGWCRPDWFRGGGSIFAEGWTLKGMDFSLHSHKVKARASVTLRQENKAEQVESPETEVPGGWAHAVFVYDGPRRKLSLYLNGKRVAQRAVSWEKLQPAGRGWRIGGADPLSGMGGQFNGVMDEVVLWRRALSEAEIERLYERGRPDPGTAVKAVPRPPLLARTATELPTADQVVAHFDFEGKLAPALASPETVARFSTQFVRGCPAREEGQTLLPDEPRFRAGRFGKGLYLAGKGALPRGEALAYGLGRLPVQEGAIALWFKPDWKWGKGSHRLLYNKYTMLAATVEGERVIGYCGLSDAGGIVTMLVPHQAKRKEPAGEEGWHHLVLSWYRDGTAQFFLDGAAGERTYAPLRDFGPQLFLGSDHLMGTDRDTGELRPDAVLDELTVFEIGLSPAQVTKLYEQKRPLLDSMEGLFCTDGRRTAFRRGEKLSWHFRCLSHGEFRAALRQGEKTWSLKKGRADKDIEVVVDSMGLRPGRYELEAHLTTDRGRPFTVRRLVIVREDREPPVTFGVLSFLRDETDEDRIVQAGFHHVRVGTPDLPLVDRLYGKGLHYSPTLLSDSSAARLLMKHGVPPDRWRQLHWRPNGKHEWVEGEHPSPFSPVAQEAKRETLRSLVAPLIGHPAFRYLCLYDEYLVRLDVSPPAQAHFRKATGLTVLPDFKPRPSGSILPDDDPYVRWIDTMGVDFWTNGSLGVEDRGLTEEVHRVAPQARTFSSPSSGMGSADFESPEIYPYLIEGPLGRELGNPELMPTVRSCFGRFRG